MQKIKLTINDRTFTATLENNETARQFEQQLPTTLEMSELNGNEKYYYMNSSLPTDEQAVGSIQTGDIMLYGDKCVVLFYEDFSTSYSYTRIGAVDNPSGLAEALGNGDATVTLELA